MLGWWTYLGPGRTTQGPPPELATATTALPGGALWPEVLVERGRTSGVRLEDGEVVHADTVVANADATRLAIAANDGTVRLWSLDR